MDRFRIRSGFETIQMLFHSGVVNAQEFVGGGHHVNTIGLSLSTFLIHKLVHRLIGGGTLEDVYKRQAPSLSPDRTIQIIESSVL